MRREYVREVLGILILDCCEVNVACVLNKNLLLLPLSQIQYFVSVFLWKRPVPFLSAARRFRVFFPSKDSCMKLLTVTRLWSAAAKQSTPLNFLLHLYSEALALSSCSTVFSSEITLLTICRWKSFYITISCLFAP